MPDHGARHAGCSRLSHAAIGHYALLKPLPPVTHVIDFGGALPSVLQAATYTLIIE
jgi:hypothetical protein